MRAARRDVRQHGVGREVDHTDGTAGLVRDVGAAGLTAMPHGFDCTGTVAMIELVERSTTRMALAKWSVTYARVSAGLNATATGFEEPGIVPLTVLVDVSIT
jgi:hypothetical protein